MRSLHQERLHPHYKEMHQSFTRANSINSGHFILELGRHPSSLIANLRQKHHVREGRRFPSPQLMILLRVHTKTSLMGSTNVPYVRMR